MIRTELTVAAIGHSLQYRVPDTVVLLDRPPSTAAVKRYQQGGPTLRWMAWGCKGEPRLSPPVAGCLSNFIKLANAPSEEVIEFARVWGVLGICEHHEPSTHREGCLPLGVGRNGLVAGRLAPEPLSQWDRFAVSARNVVLAMIGPLEGRPTYEKTEWWAHLGWIPSKRFPYDGDLRDVKPQLTRDEIAVEVSAWLVRAGLRLTTVWDADRGAFRHILGPDMGRSLGSPCGHLFSVLAMQLAAAVSSPHGTYQCSNPTCRDLYTPERKPQEGREHYCLSCQTSGKAKKATGNLSYHKNKDRWPSVARRPRSKPGP
jgi:hypothetical protein